MEFGQIFSKFTLTVKGLDLGLVDQLGPHGLQQLLVGLPNILLILHLLLGFPLESEVEFLLLAFNLVGNPQLLAGPAVLGRL
jgi:hypothetical protein